MSEDEGPPVTRQYPVTPMPIHEEPERDEDTQSHFWTNSIIFLVVAIAIGWALTVLRADVNVIIAYQQEHVGQYKHMIALLENMQQVKWQMVPSS